MRSIQAIFLILTMGLLLAVPARAETYQAGRDYEVLPFPQDVNSGNKVEVREFFWYGCPHCYAFEPYLDAWLKHKPANVEFIRTPAVTPRWKLHAVTFYALRELKVGARLHQPLFDALHEDEKRGPSERKLFDQDGLADWVAAHGVNRQKYLEATRSFGVQFSVNQAKRLFDDYNLDGVPNIIVDGRYRTSPTLVHDEARVMKVVDYLVHKAAAERSKRK